VVLAEPLGWLRLRLGVRSKAVGDRALRVERDVTFPGSHRARVPRLRHDAPVIRVLRWLVALSVVLVFAGCSGDDASRYGTYRGNLDGTVYLLEIPTTLDDPLVQQVEEFRVRVGGKPPAYYIRAEIDNRKGKYATSSSAIQFRDERGREVSATWGSDQLATWATLPGADGKLAGLQELRRMVSPGISPGQRGAALFVAPRGAGPPRSVIYQGRSFKLES
jgi:hypothetical protein